MIIKGSQKYIRSSEQKIRFVADSVKGLTLPKMREQLTLINKDAARRILQTLDQTIANAQHNFGVNVDQLELLHLRVLRGPVYKRMRAVSRGQGHAILKRTSHIMIELQTKETVVAAPKAEEVKTEEVAAPVEAKKTVKKPAAKKTTKKVETKDQE